MIISLGQFFCRFNEYTDSPAGFLIKEIGGHLE